MKIKPTALPFVLSTDAKISHLIKSIDEIGDIFVYIAQKNQIAHQRVSPF